MKYCLDPPGSARRLDPDGPYLCLMTIRQYPVSWTGLVGGTGYSFFYTSTAVDISGVISPLFDAIKAFFPGPLVWKFPGLYRELDETNGQLTNVVQGADAGSVAATGTNAYIPQAGAQIRWNTSGFPHGRRVVGRTYLVPLHSSYYGINGLITSTTANTINAAADALRSRAGGELSVWHRPILEKNPDPTLPDIVKRPGSRWPVTGTVCPTKSATLNSRRDT